MTDQPIHECECPHPDCEAMLRISEATPAGVYQCWCHIVSVRLSWSTAADCTRNPYLTLERPESE